MIGYFIVDSFSKDKDSQGFETGINVSVKYDMNLKGFLYLPPHLRKSQCDIAIGSEVFGVMDDVTGLGVAMFGVNCDINFKNLADYEFSKTLTVDGATTLKDKLDVTKDITSSTGDIKASVGDVKATAVSLKTHTHPATLAVAGTITPAGAVEGTATGSTSTPT